MAEQDDSFEAANAIPGIADDMDDDLREREPIDLDVPVKGIPTPTGAIPVSPAETAMPVTETAMPVTETTEPIELGDSSVQTMSSKEVEELKAGIKQANDERLRAQADLQNFRRRGEEERLRIIRDANERLIKELLPVLDDFDLALDAARKTESYEQLIGGVSAILRKFQDTLGKQGVAAIPAVGEPFSAEVHEAVMLDEESEEPDETVTAELRKGYTLHERVIRPSLVKVAKKS